MTVPVQTPINSYVYAGGTSFIYSFQLLQSSDLLVTVDGATKTLGIDYTVDGVGAQAGGSITYLGTLTAGQLVSLSRQTQLARTKDYQTLGDFLAGTFNADFDRLWMALQERQTNDARAVRAPSGETLATLPAALSRAGFLLGFDGAGSLSLIAAAAQSATALALSLLSNSGSTQVNYLPAGAGGTLRSVQSKLRDVVSPTDFGADPTGGLDSTTAFANALATGKDVYVPPGTYLITGALAMSTTQQQMYGAGRTSILNCVYAASTTGITFSGSSGRQGLTGLTVTVSANCPVLLSHKSPQVKVLFCWLTNTTSGGVVSDLINEANPIFCFGTVIGHTFIHGSFTTGSRGIRCGLNSQTSKFFGNTIDNFETGIAVNNATDTLTIEDNIIEQMMSTGHGVDLRGTSGSPTYHNISIRRNHFEDVYSAVCRGGVGSTYTGLVIEQNYYFGHAGGTNYFLTDVATIGAGSANCRVEYNTVVGNLTSFFNLGDANGAASLVATKGNTVLAGTYATGTYASSAYTIRQINTYFGGVRFASGAFATESVTRQEIGTATAQINFKWERGEYLESIQVSCVPSAGAPTIALALHQVTGNTDTVLASIAAVSANGLVTLPVNTYPQPGYHYYLTDTGVAGGGTAYRYPYQAYFRQ